MKEEGWEIVYKKHGDLYPDIIPRIKKYAQIFREHKYKKILDLGCGTGRNTLFFAQEGFLVYALDASKTGISITKKKAEKLGLRNINYKVADMKHTSYPDNYFDAVICVFVLSHGLLKDNQEAVDEIYRILKPKGMLVTEFMSIKDASYGRGKEIEANTFLGGMKDDPHMAHHYFSRKEIKQVLSKFSHFKIKPATYFGEIKAFDIEAIK
ncbi:class I SAM-dependent methyltransferase [Candidatus Woesearchaeota archaeon]|nr:class I SAM-dependent methyltransferase [Candidatus Woesearchaeota archaeon]